MFDSTWRFDAAEPGQAPSRPLRVLVTGVDGPVGCNLADWLARRASVIGLYRDHPVRLPECQTDRWDWTRPGALARWIRQAKPHWIIHCGAFARGSWDLLDERDTFDNSRSRIRQNSGVGDPPPRILANSATFMDVGLERAVCRALISASQRVEARLTVLSTDAVFAGPRMFHDEQSLTLSEHPAARAALAMEAVLEGSGALVVRTHAYGWSPREDQASSAERVWLSLTEGLPCALAPHANATPILAADLAPRLHAAYERRLSGLYHISGAERTSEARFAAELASLAGLPLPETSEVSKTSEVGTGSLASENLRETSLNTRRAQRDLASPMPMLRHGLAGLLAQLRDGTRERLQGRLAVSARAEAA